MCVVWGIYVLILIVGFVIRQMKFGNVGDNLRFDSSFCLSSVPGSVKLLCVVCNRQYESLKIDPLQRLYC